MLHNTVCDNLHLKCSSCLIWLLAPLEVSLKQKLSEYVLLKFHTNFNYTASDSLISTGAVCDFVLSAVRVTKIHNLTDNWTSENRCFAGKEKCQSGSLQTHHDASFADMCDASKWYKDTRSYQQQVSA